MLGYGNDRGMGIDCEAMEAEEGVKGRGVLVKGTLMCRAAGAEAVTWSKMGRIRPLLTPS